MTYREILALYKEGKLEEAKQKEVEADIEKQDAISEYLCEEGEIPSFAELESSDCSDSDLRAKFSEQGSEAPATQSEQDFVKTIKKTIRHAFIKMGVIVGAAVLAITLFVVFALPHLTSLFYYNPNEIVKETDEMSPTNRMSLDMAVYTELFVPGYYRDVVTATARGYGEYDIQIRQTSSMNGIFTNVSGYLNRNRIVLYDTNYLKLPSDNVFMKTEDTFSGFAHDYMGGEPMGASGTRTYAFEKLKDLHEDTDYIAYITLKHLTGYDEFNEWFQSKELIWKEIWCAVYAEKKAGLPYYNVGFTPYHGGTIMDYDEECYPLLRSNGELSFSSDSESMQTHFISMLKYMRDNETFYEMINQGKTPVSDFDALIQLIEENGLQLNGFAIVAEKEELIRLSEDEKVYYIHTTPMR